MGLNNGLWRRGKGRAASRASRTFQPVQNRLSGGMTEPTSAALPRALSPSLFLFTIVYGGMVVLAGVLGDRKSAVLGKSVSVRVDLGGRRITKKKQHNTPNTT